jgi:hypothetical protein
LPIGPKFDAVLMPGSHLFIPSAGSALVDSNVVHARLVPEDLYLSEMAPTLWTWTGSF